MEKVLERYKAKIYNTSSNFVNIGFDKDGDFLEAFLRKNFVNDAYNFYHDYSMY